MLYLKGLRDQWQPYHQRRVVDFNQLAGGFGPLTIFGLPSLEGCFSVIGLGPAKTASNHRLQIILTASAQPAPVVETAPVVESSRCPNCGTDLLGTYCYRCGEKMFHEKDLSLRHFLAHSLHELTHLDSKIFATLRYLFTRPGFLTQEYLSGRRLHYVKPLSLFLVACAVFLLADSVRPVNRWNIVRMTQDDKTGRLDAGWEKMASLKHLPKEVIVEQVAEKMHKMATATQLANVLAMAVVLALFYRRRYFTGHLVFACHFLVFNFLVLVLLSPLMPMAENIHIRTRWLRILWWLVVQNAVYVGYLFLALRRVYGQGALITAFKAISTYTILQFLIFLTMVITLSVAAAFAAMA